MVPFRLLDLPPELWSRICQLAVTYDGEVLVKESSDKSDISGGVSVKCLEIHSMPPLVYTCSAIREEATQLFYSLNRFTVTGWQTSAFCNWMCLYSGDLQDVTVKGCSYDSSIGYLAREMEFHRGLRRVVLKKVPNLPDHTTDLIVVFPPREQGVERKSEIHRISECRFCNGTLIPFRTISMSLR